MRFGNAHVARDDSIEHRLCEVRPHIGGHLLGERVAPVEHGQDDARQLQPRIPGSFTGLMGLHRDIVNPSSA